MHIVIIGIGGVGAYFGGKLAQAGRQVTFVARGASLNALREKGLRVISLQEETFTTRKFNLQPSIEKIKNPDIILVCTKSWQVKNVAEQIAAITSENTVVIPLQNGADNADKLLMHLKPKNVMGGLCKLYSKLEEPGVVHHFGHTPELIFGEIDHNRSDRAKEVYRVLNGSGFQCTLSEHIQVDIWTKFMFIATVSGLGGLTRVSIDQMYHDPGLRKLLKQTAEEIYEISVIKNIDLPRDMVTRVMNFISKQPKGATASTQRDLMEGKPSELENFNGYIVREGDQLNIQTPVNDFIYHCLKPMEQKARML